MIRMIQRRLIIPRGDTGSFSIPTIAVASASDVAVFTVFDCLTRTKVFEKTTTPTDDTLTFEFTHNDTVNLTPGYYVWDIKFYKNPVYADGALVNGDEVNSYYAGYTLPACEIRETGDNMLVGDNAPSTTLTPEQLNIISAALSDIQEAVAQTESNVSHYPTIIDNEWWVWDATADEYITTGVSATGITTDTVTWTSDMLNPLDLIWILGRNVNDSGNPVNSARWATTKKIQISGTRFKWTGAATNGTYAFTTRILEYDASENFISRSEMAQGEIYTVSADCQYVAFTTGYAATSAPSMTQAMIDEFFSVECYAKIGKILEPLAFRADVYTGKRRKLYCLGDSITSGIYASIGASQGAGPTEYGYPYWVGKLNNYDVVNLGIGGTGYIATSSSSAADNGCNIVDNNSFEDADLITIAYGVNDYKSTNATIGSIAESTLRDGSIIGNMKYCIETIAEKAPKAKIIIISPQNGSRAYSTPYAVNPQVSDNWYMGTPVNGRTLKQVKEAIAEVADYYGLQLIDLYSIGPVNRLNIRTQLGDGNHPTKECYERIGRALSRLII